VPSAWRVMVMVIAPCRHISLTAENARLAGGDQAWLPPRALVRRRTVLFGGPTQTGRLYRRCLRLPLDQHSPDVPPSPRDSDKLLRGYPAISAVVSKEMHVKAQRPSQGYLVNGDDYGSAAPLVGGQRVRGSEPRRGRWLRGLSARWRCQDGRCPARQGDGQRPLVQRQRVGYPPQVALGDGEAPQPECHGGVVGRWSGAPAPPRSPPRPQATPY